jgi:hypothetical protein
MIIVVVHLNLAVGNHAPRQYEEKLSTLKFGQKAARQPPAMIFGTTTSDSSLRTVDQARFPAREQSDGSLEAEYKSASAPEKSQEMLLFSSLTNNV